MEAAIQAVCPPTPVVGDRYVAMLPALVFVLLTLSWMMGLGIGLILPDSATLRLMVRRWRLSSVPIRVPSNELRKDISGVVLLEDDLQGTNAARTPSGALQLARRASSALNQAPSLPTAADDDEYAAQAWPIGPGDLMFFRRHCDALFPEALPEGEQEPDPKDAGWQLLLQREVPGSLHFTAWCRTLPCGGTEYLSRTIGAGASAHEVLDFYLDDSYRPRWDPYLTHTSALQVGRAAQREMLVRWRRSFPMHFLTDREYIIARRAFVDSGSGSLYGIERSVPHSTAEESHVVAVQRYYSMYRCRDVQDPWGEGRTGPPRLACESVLLHHQALLVPERMVRLTVKLGMWGYVKGMAACLPAFCEGRRARAGPHEPDAGAYGCELYAAAPGAATDHGRAAAGASGAGRMVQLAAAPAGEVVEADVVEDGPQLLGQQAAGGMTGAEAAAGSGDGASGSNSSTSSGGGRRQGRGSVSYVVQLRHGHCEVQPQGSSSQQQGRGQARLPPPVQTATGEGAADRRYQRHQQQMAPATPLQVSPFAAASHSRTSSTGSTAHDSAASAHLAAASAISRAGRRSRGGSRAWGHAGWSLAHLRRLAAAALRDEMVWMMVTAVAAGGASAWLAQRSGGRGGGSRRAAHHPRLLGSCSSDVDYGEESEEPED